MYQKVNSDLNFVDREKEVEKFWKDNDIFKKSMENRKEGPTYTFYDGPPTANGKPHIGHVLTRVIKDMIPRYRTMKGYMVPRKAGWDTHGLPVELEVEKELGLDGKEQIEEYGLDPFIRKCKESVWKYKGMWEDFSGTVGFWADMDDPYVTYHDDFIESEWWALKQIWDKGLLYKGFKIVPYCPRCGTPLSSHEVAQGYKAVKERSAVVRFKVIGEDAYFLAWTTTLWTLPSSVALCVNPDETYCKVKAADGYTYVIRCTPSIVLLFIVFYGLPKWMEFAFAIYIDDLSRAVFVIITFTLLFGAYVSEVFRSAYLAVPKGQYEAAVTIGLSPLSAFIHVMLPQAAVIALPNFGNSVINLLKESALAYTIGLIDLLGRTNLIIAKNYGGYGIELYTASMILYWALSIVIERSFLKLETSLSHERRMS